MKVIGINGSPRKNWNTYKMVESALKGCSDAGAETKFYHLHELNFKGCSSCFACLRLGGPSYGKCAMRDDLTQVLDDVLSADVLIVGSPVYFGDITAGLRAFCERLWFAGLSYAEDRRILYTRRFPVKIIFTTNAPTFAFHTHLNESIINSMTRFIGPTELIEANSTWQFDDYSKYEAGVFDVERKQKRHEEVFPQDLQNAYEMGRRAVAEAEAGVE